MQRVLFLPHLNKELMCALRSFRMPTLLQNTDKPSPMALDKVGQVPSPRVVKTHLPFYLLPSHLVDTCKVRLIKDKIGLSGY